MRVVLTCGLLAAVPLAGQELPPPEILHVTAGWEMDRPQPHDAVLTFALSRRLSPEERIAVVIGAADVTALLAHRDDRAWLPLRGAGLPPGELPVEVWHVTGDSWRLAASLRLRRLTRTGFEAAGIRPRLELQSDGQLGARRPAGAPSGPRGDTFQTVSLSGGGEGMLRRGTGELRYQALVTGVSDEPARLRAAQLGPSAPILDLASYELRLNTGPISLAAGHLGFGAHRLLANQFRSRGISSAFAGRHLLVQVGTAAGSEIVGWDDPLGLTRPAHRVITSVVALEAVPSRPGALRVDFTALEGSVQPLPGFGQQAVTERASSRGLGMTLSASDPWHRARLSVGAARSRFANPPDPAMAGDATLVPVQIETREARFGELSLSLVRGSRILTLPVALGLTARHERVDPLYRTIAAFVQSDREQNGVELTGSLGSVQWQAGSHSGRDNLDRIPSMLTTRSSGRSFVAALPVAALLGAAPEWWWPLLNVAWQMTEQRGGGVPENGGFRTLSQIPDQVTTNLTAGSVWQHARWNVGYRFNRSLVDNRQPERETTDFTTTVHGGTLGTMLGRQLSMMLDMSHEALHSAELDTRSTGTRVGAQADWRPFRHTAFGGAASLAHTHDDAATQRGRNVELRVEASQGVDLWRQTPGASQARVFVRWARSSGALRFAGAQQPGTAQWAINGGLSLRFF